jgi:hypothetical protein
MTTRPDPISALALALPLALGALTACDGGDEPSHDGDLGPAYAMMVQVYTEDDRTVYAYLTDTLDLVEVDLEGAHEQSGVANMIALDGRLLISDGQAPTITAYDVAADLALEPAAEISFADYPVFENANFYFQFVLDRDTAYMPYDVTSRLVWNPMTMEIVDTREETGLEPADAPLVLEPGGNRDGVHYDDAVLQSFFYHDEDWFGFGEESHIVVYDPDSHEERAILDAPCPGLAIATRDEDGNTYFSTWDYAPTLGLFGDAPTPCAVKVTPDFQIDESWTTDFTAWTGGRYVNNWRYVGGGKAVASVLDHDKLAADFELDFDGDFDPAAAEHIWDDGMWQTWIFDMESETATPIEGVDVEGGSAGQYARLDGRTFLFVTYEEWSRTRIYELDDDGRATEVGDTIGDVFKWIRIR